MKREKVLFVLIAFAFASIIAIGLWAAAILIGIVA